MREDSVFFDEVKFSKSNVPETGRDLVFRSDDKSWRLFVELRKEGGKLGDLGRVSEYLRILEGIAWPSVPAHLMKRVHGAADFKGFCDVGERVALDLLKPCANYLDLDGPLKILDFGCGCGRVLFPLSATMNKAEFFGTDIDRDAIEWVNQSRSLFPSNVKQIVVNNDLPKTSFNDGEFDLVYAISVFTHLPAEMQDLWFAELIRILKPGGLLLLSTQNQTWILPYLTKETAEAFLEHGMYYFPYQSTEGLPEYYQAAWHTSQYTDKHWIEHADKVVGIPFGINDHQDISVYRKR